MSVSLTFRCPDDLAELIKHQVETTGKDKTSVLVGMLKQSLLALPLEERNNLPAIPAVYLVYQEDKLLYVGKTKNLKSRWLGHHRLVQFVEAGSGVYIAWFPCSEEQLGTMEDAFIELLDPEFNGESLLGTNKRLATFRIDKEEWKSFKALCNDRGQNASAVLNEFVSWYNSGNRIPTLDSNSINPNSVEQSLDERITAGVESALLSRGLNPDNVEQLLDERITAKVESLVDSRGLKPETLKEQLEEHTAYLATGLNATISELSKQLEELRGKLKAR